jgi:hypothetical protein
MHTPALLGALIFAITATPVPSATPLKTILHVRTSPFCTIFNDTIRHSVEGILTNDALLARGSVLLRETGHDLSVGFDAHTQLDMNRMEIVQDQILHNLDLIDKLLNSLPEADSSTIDGRLTEQMKVQLQAAARQQNLELNSISGTIGQIQLDELQNADVSFGGALSSGIKLPDTGVLAGGPLTRQGPTNKTDQPYMGGIAVPLMALNVQTSREIAAQGGLTQSLLQAADRCK